MSDTRDIIKAVIGGDVVPSFVKAGGATGFENMDNDCISIPFLRLAQVNTPQAQPGDKKIPGLEAGMYFNPSTGSIYGKEPSFIIMGFHRSWNVWNGEPPNARFVRSVSNAEYDRTYRDKTTTDGNKTTDKDGNRYQDTRNFFILMAEHPEDGVLMYPMTSTGIPASKRLLAKSSAIKVKDDKGMLVSAPMWVRVWKPKVNFIQSPKGNYYQMQDALDCGWVPANLAAIAESTFLEVMAYDKTRVTGVDTADPITADTPFSGQF